MSSSDERALLATLCKQRDDLAKSKLPPGTRDALKKSVDGFVAEAQKVVAVHGDLLKRLEQQQKERKDLDARDRALAAAAKAFPGKLSAATPKMQQALKALAEAKAKAGSDAASLAKVGRGMQDLHMTWIDLSVFQDLLGY